MPAQQATSCKQCRTPRDLGALMEGLGRAAVQAAAVLAQSADTAQKNAALRGRSASRAARRGGILAANAQDMDAARARGLRARCSIACSWMTTRVEAMAAASRRSLALPDPIGSVAAEWQRPNGLRIQRVRVPLGRHRHHLREPPQRDRRCRRAVPEVRQCRDPARRVREPALQRARSMPVWWQDCERRACRRPASSSCPTTRSRRRGLHAAGHDRVHRRHRAARRQETGRARAEGGARAGDRPPRGQLPRVRRSGRGRAHGARDRRSTPSCAAPASAALPKPCWWIAACAATHLAPIVRDLLEAGCEVRGDAAVQAADPRVKPATEAGLVHRISGCRSSPRAWSTAWMRRSRTSRNYGSAHTESIVTANAATAERFLRARRQRHRAAQRLHAVRRRRRVRHGRGDRHFHRPLPCARPGRRASSSPATSTSCAAAGRCGS